MQARYRKAPRSNNEIRYFRTLIYQEGQPSLENVIHFGDKIARELLRLLGAP